MIPDTVTGNAIKRYQAHFSYLRMSRERFEHLAIVGPLLVRKENYWSAIRATAERLALTIRYLATGKSQISLSFNFCLGKSTVCHIFLRETCEALWNTFMLLYVLSIFVPFFSQHPKACIWIASYCLYRLNLCCLHQLLLIHPKTSLPLFYWSRSHVQNEI